MSKHTSDSGEESFIQRYFAPLTGEFSGAFGLRDDAAVFDMGAGFEVAATVDAVASGVHFFFDDKAADIAWKALAVNVSDLAAMAAEPVLYLLSAAFPHQPDAQWMTDFCQGLAAAQSAFGIKLAGGDTDVRAGPLTLTVTAIGRVPAGASIRRSGGTAGDRLFVTGTIGDAGLGLALRGDARLRQAWRLSDAHADAMLQHYLRPEPRVGLTAALRAYATAAIDISDGLAKDCCALARASGRGVHVECKRLPLSDAARKIAAAGHVGAADHLTAGGDYELLAAIPLEATSNFIRDAGAAGVTVTEIGRLTSESEMVFAGPDNVPMQLGTMGYDHFS